MREKHRITLSNGEVHEIETDGVNDFYGTIAELCRKDDTCIEDLEELEY